MNANEVGRKWSRNRKRYDLLLNFTSLFWHYYSYAKLSGDLWRNVRKTLEHGSWPLKLSPACRSWRTVESFIYHRKWGEDFIYACTPVWSRKSQLGAFWLICFFLLPTSIYTFIQSLFRPRARDLTEIMSSELKFILFVMLEHFLLLVAWLIHKAIPDRPSSVRTALARVDYESKQALKREVL